LKCSSRGVSVQSGTSPCVRSYTIDLSKAWYILFVEFHVWNSGTCTSKNSLSCELITTELLVSPTSLHLPSSLLHAQPPLIHGECMMVLFVRDVGGVELFLHHCDFWRLNFLVLLVCQYSVVRSVLEYLLVLTS
jgi:hypothetical protein